jgi:hypothetical protein
MRRGEGEGVLVTVGERVTLDLGEQVEAWVSV